MGAHRRHGDILVCHRPAHGALSPIGSPTALPEQPATEPPPPLPFPPSSPVTPPLAPSLTPHGPRRRPRRPSRKGTAWSCPLPRPATSPHPGLTAKARSATRVVASRGFWPRWTSFPASSPTNAPCRFVPGNGKKRAHKTLTLLVHGCNDRPSLLRRVGKSGEGRRSGVGGPEVGGSEVESRRRWGAHICHDAAPTRKRRPTCSTTPSSTSPQTTSAPPARPRPRAQRGAGLGVRARGEAPAVLALVAAVSALVATVLALVATVLALMAGMAAAAESGARRCGCRWA